MIHPHVAARAYGEARRRILTRRCPECGLAQLTPEEQLNEAVPCERCAAPVPPNARAYEVKGKGAEVDE